MNAHMEAAGIQPISKEDYLKECERGLEIMAISTCGSGDVTNIQDDDVLMVSMCKPGEDEPHVSYAKIGSDYLFTRGWPWIATPLKSPKEPEPCRQQGEGIGGIGSPAAKPPQNIHRPQPGETSGAYILCDDGWWRLNHKLCIFSCDLLVANSE